MWSAAANGRAAVSLARLGPLAVALLWLSVGCQSVPPVVKIGLVAPFEGQYRPIGYDVIYSARLAVRQINAAGGAAGYRLALVALDDSGAPDLAAAAAASLAIDPGVVAVLGHWRPETTAAAWPIYKQYHLPLVATGRPPLATYDPAALPLFFLDAYAAVTPFDKVAGPHAGPAFDAMQLVIGAVRHVISSGQSLSRSALAAALADSTHQGMTGRVYQPAEP